MPASEDLLSCFGAYDIRGLSPEIIDENAARRIGHSMAKTRRARKLVIGHDARATSPKLAAAASLGMREAGSDVIELGLCGTEEVYFATAQSGADGGISVTASHNPMEYNGFKLIGPNARVLSGQGGLDEIRKDLTSCQGRLALQQGRRVNGRRMRAAFVEKVLSFLPDGPSNPLTILVNAGNGAAGPTVDAIISALQASAVPWHFIRHNHVPDTQFPKGIPNPLLRENRLDMTQAVRNAGCSFGVAWDGDFDRCFFFDERGCFIPGEYIVAILARHFCKGEKGKIVYDPRVTGCIESEVSAANGQAILSRCGHVFMKEAMQASGAAYGGERSGHHYFRDFMGCDSGMIPMLVVAGILAKGTLSLSEITEPYRIHFPSSEEINFTIESIENTMNIVMQKYADRAGAIDCFDGLSARFPTWRFNLRPSKTENCLRLCVESTRDRQHVEEKALEISNLINGLHARPTNQATSRLVPEG